MSANGPHEHEVPDPAALYVLFKEQQQRLGAVEQQMGELKSSLAANTLVTEQVQTNTAGLVELFNNAAGAFRVLEGLGKAAKPLMYIAGFVSAAVTVYTAWRSQR